MWSPGKFNHCSDSPNFLPNAMAYIQNNCLSIQNLGVGRNNRTSQLIINTCYPKFLERYRIYLQGF
jgi:hypothetical protein